MSSFYVWARVAPTPYAPGDIVRDGEGVFLHYADTPEEARALLVSDPATYEDAAGEELPLYVVGGDAVGDVRVLSDAYRGGAWPLPYLPRRTYGVSA